MHTTCHRILYVITKSNWGGAQRYVYDLATAVATEGHEVAVASGGSGMLHARLTEAAIPVHTVQSWERNINILKDIRSFFELARIIRTLRPTIVHVNSSKAGGIGALATRLVSRACIVFTVHGLPQFEERSWLSRKTIAFLTWLTALLSHQVITITTHDHTLLAKQPGVRAKINHIPNGILHTGSERKEARERILNALSLSPRERMRIAHLPWVGTVAELTPNKGHRYALEAWNDLKRTHPDAMYILIGDGDNRAALEAYVREHALDQHIRFVGFMPDAYKLYSAFDAYLSPSIKEGLPYTLLEAMHSHVPIIATRIGGIPDLLFHGQSGHLITPRSAPEIAAALDVILADANYRETLAHAAAHRATHHFSHTQMVSDTLTCYERCTQATLSRT